MRSQEDAWEDAQESAGNLVDSLQDADASTELIDEAEKLFSRIREERE